MARIIALIVSIIAVLGASWYVYQTDPDMALNVLVLGCLFFVAPALYAVIDDD
jgi:hypothetical protein